jgi:hypothetical protein
MLFDLSAIPIRKVHTVKIVMNVRMCCLDAGAATGSLLGPPMLLHLIRLALESAGSKVPKNLCDPSSPTSSRSKTETELLLLLCLSAILARLAREQH